MDVSSEIERMLRLLRDKIHDQGYTQLKVQENLGWGRTYISQLLGRQKSLRVEQVLLILHVIDIQPSEFFAEFYRLKLPEERPSWSPGQPGLRQQPTSQPPRGVTPELLNSIADLRSMLKGLIRLLITKRLIRFEELTASVREIEIEEGQETELFSRPDD